MQASQTSFVHRNGLLMDILFRLQVLEPNHHHPKKQLSSLPKLVKNKHTHTHTHMYLYIYIYVCVYNHIHNYVYIYIFMYIYIYVYIITYDKIVHTRRAHIRFHKITQVSPKQTNSGTPSISLKIRWTCMETAIQCVPFAPVREVELRCTAMSCHCLVGHDRRMIP